MIYTYLSFSYAYILRIAYITDYVENVSHVCKPHVELCIFCATSLSNRICGIFYGTLLRRDYEYVHLES